MESYCNHRGGFISTATSTLTENKSESLATIVVDELTIERCREFALKRIGMSEALYRARGEARTHKMIEDIIVGCAAEFAVYEYLKLKGLECTAPDLSIHEQGTKSFSADLRSGAALLHVKAQTLDSAQRYGESWIFQVEDSALTLPSENGYSFFCVVEPGAKTYKVDIKAAVYIIDILEAEAVSKPKVGKYALWKSAIYLTDLINKNIDIRRF